MAAKPESTMDTEPVTRRRIRKLKGSGVDAQGRVTLNLSISKKARRILDAHTLECRGTPAVMVGKQPVDRSKASGMVEWMILTHLTDFRVSDHRAGAEEGE